MGDTVFYKNGAVVFFEGDPSGTAYIIRSGEVELTRDAAGALGGRHALGPGEVLGLADTLAGHPRISTARALSDLSMVAMRATELMKKISSNIDIGLKIVTSLSAELRELDHEIVRQFRGVLGGSGDMLAGLKEIGEYYRRKGMNHAARYAYGKYLEANPPDKKDRLEAGLILGDLCESEGEYQPALQLYEYLSSQHPDDERPARNIERLKTILDTLGMV